MQLLVTLLVEEKARADAGKLLSGEIAYVQDGIDRADRALTRAGVSKDAISKALTSASDAKIVEGLKDPDTAAAYALVGFASAEAPVVTIGVGGEVVIGAAGAAGTAAGTGAAAAGTGALATAGAILIPLAIVAGVVFLVIWTSRLPDPRVDRVAPEELEKAIERITGTLQESRQRDIDFVRPTTKPVPAPVPVPKAEPKRERKPEPRAVPRLPTEEPVPDECLEQARKLSSGKCRFVAKVMSMSPEELFCRDVTKTECEYWLHDPGGGRALAKFDAVKGRDVMECKCGYDKFIDDLNSADRRARWKANDVLYGEQGVIKEILSHLRYVQDCGLGSYRVIASSQKLADFLRRELPTVKVEVVEDPICR